MKLIRTAFFWAGLCLSAYSLQSQTPPLFLTEGLVAYYPFDGSAKDARGTNDGTLFGAATFGPDRFGNRDSSLVLPGTPGTDSGVDIPSLSNMAYQPVTYSAWFNLKDYPPVIYNTMMTLLGREACGDAAVGAIAISSGGPASNCIVYYCGATSYNTHLTPPTNRWCQVVLTISATGKPTFYLDGTNVSGVGYAPEGQPLDFRIGSSSPGECDNGPRYVWNGSIDDVRIYKRALSASQVEQLYHYERGYTSRSALAAATITDEPVAAVNIQDRGVYTNAPTVLIHGGGETNARATPVISKSEVGSVTNTPEQVETPAGVSLGFSPTLTITGTSGDTYAIQSTTNLADPNAWVTLTNVTLTQPVQTWIDTNVDARSPFNPKYFYQVLPGQ